MILGLLHCFVFTLALGTIVQSKTFNNTIYIISNAETPSLNLPGLTPIGALRAEECLPQLFAPLDVGIIVTCPLDSESGKCASTIVTATPTANWLGIPIDTSCRLSGADEETDDDCVTDLLKGFTKNSTQSVLIVWHRIESIVSQGCSGIDGQAHGTFRRRSGPGKSHIGREMKKPIRNFQG
ncbi:hypothetical protein HYPSUDRAFT_59542 [Hypholoma sublateritium FD-334 SS-4]|uniref:Uncharacterized protein n=1 Tax=Hypholoma sublateritium (strain FD-334 SS-4) TaxID=945553 RepID=A0A0D2P0E4_HYPSF|nr:hypothetical protein HYPSUDRAFT_59542 [Hypholoma sublateritium FD-334 SS-4]